MNKTALGVFFGMLAGASWGAIFLAPSLVPNFTPLQLSAARYLTYGILSLLLILPKIKRLSLSFGRKEWLALLWLSLIGNIIYYALVSNAVQLTGVAVTSIIVGFIPVTVAIIGSRDHGAVSLKRLLPSLIFGAVGIIGISWQALNEGDNLLDQSKIIGLLCAVGALLSWTAFAVGNARWLIKLPHLSSDEWNLMTGVVTGGLALVLCIPAFMTVELNHTTDDWIYFISIAASLAFVASILGNAFWNRMSRLLPLTMVGQMILFETLFALLFGFLWEQRGPTLIEVISIISVILSVILCMQAHRKPAVVTA
jgi:drug/metabolite transporter (DMT)-like permease